MTRLVIRTTFLLAIPLVTGCSSVGRIVRQQAATRTEATLVAAGFHVEAADTADRLREVDAIPPFQVIKQRKGDEEIYVYADPAKCHCEYVGDAQEYAEYKRLRNEELKAVEAQQALAAEETNDNDIDVGSRGPWSSPWWWWE
jgi:hypothetical protein